MGIMGIMALAFMTMMSNQNKEMLAMTERLAVTDVNRILLSTMNTSPVCLQALNVPTALTFNSTLPLPTEIDLGASSRRIYSYVTTATPPVVGPVLIELGNKPSALSNSLVTKSIKLRILSGSGTTYVANWVIDFDETQLVRPLKPVIIPTTLTVDNSVPAAARVSACMDEAPAAPPRWYNTSPPVRTANMTYQNTTGNTITVRASGIGFTTYAYLYLSVSHDGASWVTVDSVACFDTGSVSGAVPNGHYYRVTFGGHMGGRAISSWSELRSVPP